MSAEKRVAVTGHGAITPYGTSVDSLWKGVTGGTTGIRLYPHADNIAVAGWVPDFDPQKELIGSGILSGENPRKDLRVLSRASQFTLAAARQALLEAQLIDENNTFVPDIDPERVSTVIGTCLGGAVELPRITLEYSPKRGISPKEVLKMGIERPAAVVPKYFGFTGAADQVSAACATGNRAIELGMNKILVGDADIVIVGGVDAMLSAESFDGYRAAISYDLFSAAVTHDADPERASRPFNADSNGFVMGEGAGVLILEAWDRGHERAIVELAAVHSTSDLRADNTLPSVEGQVRAFKGALKKAGIVPEDTEGMYVSAHATSTDRGDEVEAESIAVSTDRFDPNRVFIDTPKDGTGHLIGAAGAVEAVIMAKVVSTGVVPGVLHHENLIPEARNLNLQRDHAEEHPVTVGVSNSFGFGGQNATAVMRKVGV